MVLRRKLIPEFLISGDLLNSLFRVVLSSSVSRLYFSWECLAEDFQKFLHPIAGGLHGLSDFLYQFIGGRGIRRTLHVVLMGFAYIVKDSIPCFVCHMTEKNLLPLSDRLPEFSGNGLRQLRDVLPVSLPRTAASALLMSWNRMVAFHPHRFLRQPSAPQIFSWDIISHSSRVLIRPLFRSATASSVKCSSDSGVLICSLFLSGRTDSRWTPHKSLPV